MQNLDKQIAIDQTAQTLLAIVCRMGNSLGAKAPELLHPVHLSKIRHFISQGIPVHFILPAFPAKSPNPQKTLGIDPDHAELLALQKLQHTCELINEIYSPGAKITICSDGRVFSDLVMVKDNIVTRYRLGIERMIKEFDLISLNTFHMEDLFTGLDFTQMREKLSREYGRSLEVVKEDICHNEKDKFLFNGMHRFLFEDRAALPSEKSRNQIREETKDIAYQVIQRSNSWSKLVETIFPDAVRLSIHPQFVASEKLAFQMVETTNVWATPWHSVALRDEQGFRLVKRQAAIDAGAQLVNDKYPYYVLNGITQ